MHLWIDPCSTPVSQSNVSDDVASSLRTFLQKYLQKFFLLLSKLRLGLAHIPLMTYIPTCEAFLFP